MMGKGSWSLGAETMFTGKPGDVCSLPKCPEISFFISELKAQTMLKGKGTRPKCFLFVFKFNFNLFLLRYNQYVTFY